MNTLHPILVASTIPSQRSGGGFFGNLCQGMDHLPSRYAMGYLAGPGMRVVVQSTWGSASVSMSVPLLTVPDTGPGIAGTLRRSPVLRKVAVPPTRACQPLAARTWHLCGCCIEFGTHIRVHHTSPLLAWCFGYTCGSLLYVSLYIAFILFILHIILLLLSFSSVAFVRLLWLFGTLDIVFKCGRSRSLGSRRTRLSYHFYFSRFTGF